MSKHIKFLVAEDLDVDDIGLTVKLTNPEKQQRAIGKLMVVIVDEDRKQIHVGLYAVEQLFTLSYDSVVGVLYDA